MSPNKIIPFLKWGYSNTLSLDGFYFLLHPENQKKIQNKYRTFLKSHLYP